MSNTKRHFVESSDSDYSEEDCIPLSQLNRECKKHFTTEPIEIDSDDTEEFGCSSVNINVSIILIWRIYTRINKW